MLQIAEQQGTILLRSRLSLDRSAMDGIGLTHWRFGVCIGSELLASEWFTTLQMCIQCGSKHGPLLDKAQAGMAVSVDAAHMVFCIPKALRYGFIRNRNSLNVLSRLAFEAIKEFTSVTLSRKEPPGAVQVIQTHGNMLNTNPHVPVIVSDGVFTETGTFYQLPEIDRRGKELLKHLFEKRVIKYCLKDGFVRETTVISC